MIISLLLNAALITYAAYKLLSPQPRIGSFKVFADGPTRQAAQEAALQLAEKKLQAFNLEDGYALKEMGMEIRTGEDGCYYSMTCEIFRK